MRSLETAVRAGSGLVVVALLGTAWLRARLPAGLTALERTVARLLAGGAMAAVAALLLADLGLYTGWALLALLAALAVAGLAVNRPAAAAGELPSRGRVRDLGLLGLVVVLLVFALPTFAWILGGRDPGTYVNAAVQIEKTHHLDASYDRLREVPADVLPQLSLWEPDPIKGQPAPPPPADAYERDAWPGMYLREPDRILPQGFHLLPAAMAAGASASGDYGLWILPAAAVLALLACALYAGRLLESAVAEAVTGVLLVASVGFVWFARYPTSEMLDLTLTFGGLWLALLASRTDSAYLGGMAGFVLGASLLTRPDAALTVAAVALLVVWLVAGGRFRRVWGWFAAAFAAVGAAAGVQALVFARPYLDDVSRHFDGAGVKIGAAAGVALLLTIAAARLRDRIDRRHAAALALAAMLVFAAVAVRSGWLGFAWLRWYMSDLGLAAAAVGAAVVLLRARFEEAALLLFLAVATLLLYGREPRISEDQFWGFRRFLPVVLPAFAILCGAAAAAAVAARSRWRPATVAAAVVAAAFLLPKLALDLRPTLGHEEYRGASSAVARLDAKLGAPDSLVLFGPRDQVLHRFGPALAFQRDRDAYPVRRVRSHALVSWLVEQAHERPVRLVTFGRLPPLDGERLTATREARVPLALPEFDKTLGRLPDGSREIAGRLTVWRLRPRCYRGPPCARSP